MSLSAHRDAVAAEPRPARQDHTSLADEIAAHDDADTWRVYRPEWVNVYAAAVSERELTDRADASLEPEVRQAWAHFEAPYAGRIRPEDARVDLSVGSAGAIARLALHRPNLTAEFITRERAAAWADGQGFDDAVIVERNSRAEHDLKAYGVRRLGPDE